MSRYILAVEAQQDLREIRDYLTAEAGPRVARHVVGAFIVAFRRLAKTPAWDTGARIFSYLVVYRRSRGPLAIVAVIHGRRNVAQVLQHRSL